MDMNPYMGKYIVVECDAPSGYNIVEGVCSRLYPTSQFVVITGTGRAGRVVEESSILRVVEKLSPGEFYREIGFPE